MGGVSSTISDIQNVFGINQSITEAARRNDVEKIRGLLHAGEDVNQVDSEGFSALHIACAEGHLETVKFLLQQKNIQIKGRRGFTPLHRAVQYNQVNVANHLLSNNVVNINATNDCGVTSLHWAAIWGAVDCIKLLIEKGASINSRQANGQTALHCAVLHSQVECIKVLVERGCDLKVKDNEGNTPREITTEKDILSLLP